MFTEYFSRVKSRKRALPRLKPQRASWESVRIKCETGGGGGGGGGGGSSLLLLFLPVPPCVPPLRVDVTESASPEDRVLPVDRFGATAPPWGSPRPAFWMRPSPTTSKVPKYAGPRGAVSLGGRSSGSRLSANFLLCRCVAGLFTLNLSVVRLFPPRCEPSEPSLLNLFCAENNQFVRRINFFLNLFPAAHGGGRDWRGRLRVSGVRCAVRGGSGLACRAGPAEDRKVRRSCSLLSRRVCSCWEDKRCSCF